MTLTQSVSPSRTPSATAPAMVKSPAARSKVKKTDIIFPNRRIFYPSLPADII
jgi:hypothetical protein